MYETYNNVSSVAATGSQQSVDRAADQLTKTINQSAVQQMKLMENQANQQIAQTLIKQRSDLMNSASEKSANIRL